MMEPIERVRDRIAELYNQVFGLRDRSPEVLEASFDSVSEILEETEQFYEELRVRNEELILARQALEGERRRYQELFEFAPDAYLVTDAHGLVMEANRAAAEMLVIRQAHLIGKPLRLFIAPEGRTLFSHLVNNQVGANQVEIPVQPRGGQRITAEVTMMVVPGVGEKPEALRWMLRDVTEREKQHLALAASEDRFHTIFQDAHVGMQLVNLAGIIEESNRAFQEMTGYSTTYTRGREAISLMHPDDQQKFARLMHAFADGMTDYTRMEVRYNTVDGGTVWARVSISLLRDTKHLPQNMIHLVENITQEKQAAAEMVEMKRKILEGIESERLRLAQDLHDGPMQDLYAAVFKLSSDMFKPAEAGEAAGGNGMPQLGAQQADKAESTLDAAREKVQETQEMLKQVASTLRVICGELRPPTLVNLGLERAIRSHIERLMVPHPEIAVHLDMVDDRDVLTDGHRLTLFRIYQQCIANVLRHAHASEVGIHLKIEEGQTALTVWDNGIGFAMPDKMVKLTRAGHYGLAGIAERVEALGGLMTVQSAPGEGTLVRVVLPVEKE